ncbi:hypothetical protein V462_02880 [Pantoea ananatis 15320]|nr:hypothetical protein B7764_13135 [Pantoea ananatis]PKC40910.1 hypothetical protein V462_02880 [Pantoea ananatis 15320]PQK74804.1 hypothetical protein CG427_10220 [Pantoea ananatis]PQK89437.1 hypothetical protein CG432_12195 [Pantoea ananatis]PWV83377.1 hypothetical protein C7426_1198 [Pantoea ananatis]
MRKNKQTLTLMCLSILYITLCCLIFLLISDAVIDLLFSGELEMNRTTFKRIIVMSLIAGVAVGTGGYIFAKIDEYKTCKSPPSDPD